MSQIHYIVISDGGSRHNGSPIAEAYGSYKLQTADGREALAQVTFDAGDTNNVAEYKAMIAALQDLLGRIQFSPRFPGQFVPRGTRREAVKGWPLQHSAT